MRSSTVTGIIGRIAQTILADAESVDAVLSETMQKYPDGLIRLEKFNIHLGPVPIYYIGGTVDQIDLNAFRMVTNLLVELAANLVLSIETGLSVTDILEVVQWFGGKEECLPTILSHGMCLMRFGAWMLDRFPQFLPRNIKSYFKI